MTNFSEWINKVITGESSVEKQVEKNTVKQNEKPNKEQTKDELSQIAIDLDHKIKMLMEVAEKKEHDGKSASDYSTLLRKMQTKAVKLKIGAYDIDRKDDKDYQCHNSDDITEEDKVLDSKMEIILEEKLNLKPKDKKVTPVMKAIFEEEQRVYEQRKKEYNDSINAIKNSINSYDSKKKEEDPEYKSFDEQSKLNEAAAEQTLTPSLNKASDEQFITRISDQVEEGDYIYNKTEKELENYADKLAKKDKAAHFNFIKTCKDAEDGPKDYKNADIRQTVYQYSNSTFNQDSNSDSSSQSDSNNEEESDQFNKQKDDNLDAYKAYIKKYGSKSS